MFTLTSGARLAPAHRALQGNTIISQTLRVRQSSPFWLPYTGELSSVYLKNFSTHPPRPAPLTVSKTSVDRMASDDKIKTRLLIISDTHGRQPKEKEDGGQDTNDELDQPDIRRVPTGFRDPLPEVDVVIHCGDLSKGGQTHEYEETFSMLRKCRAPLKLVIAGNHDLTLDPEFFDDSDNDRLRSVTGEDAPQKAREVIKNAEADGVRYLEEGVHTFDLDNGARLTVYASPWTPVYGWWAFQYARCDPNTFDIPRGVDVAMTHGPPRGVLDSAGNPFMGNTEEAGCDVLLNAVRQARPKVHCYGHIHEAWGAYLGQWTDDNDGPALDEEKSRYIARLRGLEFSSMDDGTPPESKLARLKEISKRRGYHVDLTEGRDRLDEGKQTLFVNAAIMDIRYRPVQCPWIVDITLPKAQA